MTASRILPGDSPQALAEAVAALARGDLLGLPTETVYGLAADACNDAAVAKIFARKGRPTGHPLIVHVADAAAAARFAAQVPDAAQRLMATTWPGPLTVILPRREGVATASAGGLSTVGLRCPSHPVAQALLRACAQQCIHGLAAPSANAFGRISPTRAVHVRSEFPDGLLILDGGDCDVGIESAIVDCTRGLPVLLRPGLWDAAHIRALSGVVLASAGEAAAMNQVAPATSGTLASHYAPRARLRLLQPHVLVERLAAQAAQTHGPRLGLWLPASAREALPQPLPHGWVWRAQAATPAQAAHDLFTTLRELDDLGCDEIWVLEPGADPAWAGVRDRLQRAAA